MRLDSFLQDVKYGARGLARNPGFAVVAVLTLALGIGATTAAYSTISSALGAELPVRDIERVVALWSFDRANSRPNVVVSAADFVAWRERQQLFEALSAQRLGGVNLSGIDQPVRAGATWVTASHFQVMGVQPVVGRVFTEEENRAGGASVAMLNNRFWRNRFGQARDVVGRTILIDGQTTTIVGVLPPDDITPELVLPLTIDAASPSYTERALQVTGRLEPGATVEQVRAEMDIIAARLEADDPATHQGWGITTRPYQDEFIAFTERVVYTLIALTAFAVLLIGCANIANILLARGTVRRHELAVRAALGATRTRLVRQMLAEGLLLAASGSALGVVLAYAGISLLFSSFFTTDDLPAYLLERRFIDLPLLAMTVVTAIASTLLFGMLPALHHGRPRNEALTAGRHSGDRASGRVRNTLVMGEVAAAVVLLVTATLLLRSLVNLRNVEPGFDTNNLLLMEVTLPETVYGSPESVSTFYERVVERLAGSPGVVGAGAAERVPVEGSRFNPNRSLEIEGRPAAIGQTRSVDDIAVTPGYLETLALPLRAGRLPATSDGTNAPLVAVISESVAKRYFDTASPLGARLRLGDEPSPDVWRTVVGVVGDVRNDDIDQPPPPIVYVPAPQRPSREMTFMVRVSGDPLAHVTTARAAIAAYDADVPVYDVESMDQLLAEDIQGTSVLSSLTTTFGILALVLAAVGIYGMLAYVVAHRTREMAIRIAVGARSLDVVRHVVGGGLRFVVIGLVLGLAVSLPLANVLRGVLFGISASDPATYAVVAAVLVGSALLACLVPARRALRLDPVVALRAE